VAIDPIEAFINKGELMEAFVGQNFSLCRSYYKKGLYYWRKDSRGSDAEIDYLIQLQDKVIPIEVKAGKSKRIKVCSSF